mgnify:CR=1 FL=1
MSVIVDTCVWSLALRRHQPDESSPVVQELRELVLEGNAVLLGPIRQEILSGVPSREQFGSLRDHMRAFPDLALEPADFEEAAAGFTACRERGIQGSNTDFLICAAAIRRAVTIFTTDDDFTHFARVLPIRLHRPRFSA